MALTVAAQTSPPDYNRWLILPTPRLRTECADPPEAGLRLQQQETRLSSLPAGTEQSRQDFQLNYRRQRDFDFIRPVRASSDPVTRAFGSVFQPEVFHIGRTTTVSCSILTAIKRKNPLCLLNPVFLEVTW